MSRGRKRCMHCMQVMDYDEYCECLRRVGREIVEKASRGGARRARKKKRVPGDGPGDPKEKERTLWQIPART